MSPTNSLSIILIIQLFCLCSVLSFYTSKPAYSFTVSSTRYYKFIKSKAIINLSNNNANDENSPIQHSSSIQKSSVSYQLITHLESWLFNQTVQTVISRNKIEDFIKDIKSSSTAMDAILPVYDKAWLDGEKYIDNEKRSIKVLLGTEFTSKLLNSVETTNVYDPATVRAFLLTPVFEKMLGGILYEGIFEFLSKVDIIGNVVNRLPLIGPIRQTFTKEFKKVIDVILGDSLKTFLATFNRIAVERMVDFILSKENQQYFLKANRNLVESLITRPVTEILPLNKESRHNLKKNLWVSVNSISENELLQLVDTFYMNYSDISFHSISEAMNKIPVVKDTLADSLDVYLQSSQGQQSIQLLIQHYNSDNDNHTTNKNNSNDV